MRSECGGANGRTAMGESQQNNAHHSNPLSIACRDRQQTQQSAEVVIRTRDRSWVSSSSRARAHGAHAGCTHVRELRRRSAERCIRTRTWCPHRHWRRAGNPHIAVLSHHDRLRARTNRLGDRARNRSAIRIIERAGGVIVVCARLIRVQMRKIGYSVWVGIVHVGGALGRQRRSVTTTHTASDARGCT